MAVLRRTRSPGERSPEEWCSATLQLAAAASQTTLDGRLPLTIVVPIRCEAPRLELTPRWQRYAAWAELIVVDGSPPPTFEAHHRVWRGIARHLPVDPQLGTPMGKVGGVLTGVALASNEIVVLCDDDVVWTRPGLEQALRRMAAAAVLRPQNYFTRLPWHARWDTARSLINRATGGDWPGTLVVSKSVLDLAGGYRGDVLFENLELVRTMKAAGGRHVHAPDLFVAREPPSLRQFIDQRVRQAYDELARPWRLLPALFVLPAVLLGGKRAAASLAALSVVVAELGRRRAGGTAVFEATAALWAPAWVAERSVTAWLAVTSRIRYGGIRYRATTLRRAASSPRWLRSQAAARGGRVARRPPDLGVPPAQLPARITTRGSPWSYRA